MSERDDDEAKAAPENVTKRDDSGLDDDSPESLRLTFGLLTALAACICILPRQWVSAGILGVASLVFLGWHFRDRRRLRSRSAAGS